MIAISIYNIALAVPVLRCSVSRPSVDQCHHAASPIYLQTRRHRPDLRAPSTGNATCVGKTYQLLTSFRHLLCFLFLRNASIALAPRDIEESQKTVKYRPPSFPEHLRPIWSPLSQTRHLPPVFESRKRQYTATYHHDHSPTSSAGTSLNSRAALLSRLRVNKRRCTLYYRG
jgi:hypothetical protein